MTVVSVTDIQPTPHKVHGKIGEFYEYSSVAGLRGFFWSSFQVRHVIIAVFAFVVVVVVFVVVVVVVVVVVAVAVFVAVAVVVAAAVTGCCDPRSRRRRGEIMVV